MARQSVMLSQEQEDDIAQYFDDWDENKGGTIDFLEVGKALDSIGVKVPTYKLRLYFDKSDKDQNGSLTLDEFKKLYTYFKEDTDFGRNFKKQVTARQDIQTTGGSIDGVQHSIKDTERFAFADWISKNLGGDDECKPYLPINPDSDDLFKKLTDGILLCKLINHSVEGTIDERTINKTKLNIYLRTENQNLVLASASAIGCNVVNIGHGDLEKGIPHLVLGLLWQIIRIGLLSEINLQDHPGLVLLLEEGETIDDLLKLSPEQILIRWVNYHLAQAGDTRRITNFSGDIKDSEVYFTLLKQISPKDSGVTTNGLQEDDLERRAEAMLCEAQKIECRAFVSATDVVKGNAKLNLAFVANLFNNYPALDKPDDMDIEIIEETREEKTYRNWMNSMGVQPYVNRLYVDLQNGQVLFQLYDIIKKGCVDWKRVHMKFNKTKMRFEIIENCNYAVELGKELRFSLVGVGGTDIVDGNQTLTLALVWQLMRAYTVAMLKEVSGDGKMINDNDIVNWANETLIENKGQSPMEPQKFRSFKDPSLTNSVAILQLIDAIAPGKIKWDIVKGGDSEEDLMSNAKYAISMGRKIGARIYALPEDIVEGKPKMIMTIVACLMTVALKRNRDQDKNES